MAQATILDFTTELSALIDRCHGALRGVDAADLSAPLRRNEIDSVSDAVAAVEGFALKHGIALSEFHRAKAEG